jgi:hypothetical protein
LPFIKLSVPPLARPLNPLRRAQRYQTAGYHSQV